MYYAPQVSGQPACPSLPPGAGVISIAGSGIASASSFAQGSICVGLCVGVVPITGGYTTPSSTSARNIVPCPPVTLIESFDRFAADVTGEVIGKSVRKFDLGESVTTEEAGLYRRRKRLFLLVSLPDPSILRVY